MTATPHAAGVLLSHGDRALFLKRSESAKDHPGEWCCAGGSIELGETPEQAASRELQEETMYPAGSLTQIDEGDGFVTFRQSVDDEFTPTLNEEHSEFMWAPLSDPPKPLHPGVASTLGKLTKTGAQDFREVDDNDWFTVMDNPLSVVGVYKYSGRSIGGDADPDKLYGVYRSPEELGSQEAVDSFKLMPWTDDHPEALLGAKEKGFVPADEKGVHGVIGEQVYFKDGTLYGNLKMFSEGLARDIAAGKRELSCGYHCQFVKRDGVYEGEPYQYEQIGIRGNHVASVKRGRMGADVRVMDAAECFTFALDMKEHATDVAGASDAAKVTSGQHSPGVTDMADELKELDMGTKGVGGKAGDDSLEDIKKDEKKATDRAAARDARDSLRAKDGMTSEEEEGMDAEEDAEDAAEEKDDEEDDSDEAKKRKSARDRRAGARDQRALDRARDAKEDEKEAKEAKDKEDAMKGKGMDAAEVTALVDARVKDVIPAMRREAAAKHKLYGRLSPVIGAFDHDEMTLTDMAAYGLQKMDAPKASDPVMAIDYLLVGRGHAQAVAARPRGGMDKAEGSFLTPYLNS